ncbi:MAG: diacylglycerol kinase family lipid kinase [Candidatus Marinimicrobia bacterium]|jgi:YegS/Rv2252/BmrU family lipid kinase|nr:diacylglycerol kinase family lipid kinase [Candidatus Neomarinimicrobiota bacterium]MBT3576080.1 diacylglycerol kinase family lipid kinase [Candidatus Neomarinimicrobiota bacterium]MBT3680647.1 diacylglycerol kinase family lipid kinase [Candidatus Neomarinimicrobiota bacterium]MBT3951612.1 diacylglycerol kinase family lipid kinase [Candidatus Neomarinimicrobiota bacterium]MBT4251779.1 diacylglycerol kinase family lipid kinase [Candidatus Neomarinimicrobiota bacterium]
MKNLIIYNPWAARGRAGKLLPQIKAYLQEIDLDCDILITDHHGHGLELVKEADFSQYSAVIAAGGDGTLFEVINGYFRNNSSPRIPIGVIPVGTSNAFVKDMELHDHDWKPALDIIKAAKTQKFDVGRFANEEQTWYYLNILGVGLVADIVATANKLKFLGSVSYTLGSFYHILRLKTFQVKLDLDGQLVERENVFVEISNSRYTGNYLMAPAAKTDDGLLDITILGPKSRIGLMRSFPKIITGEHIHMEEVDCFQASHIKIESNIPKVLTPDGELMGTTPLEIDCLKQAIDVFWK